MAMTALEKQQQATDEIYQKYLDAICSDWSYRRVAEIDRLLAVEIEKLNDLKRQNVRVVKKKTKTRKRD